MKRASYREAIQWIALNDYNNELDPSRIVEKLSTVMIANLFGIDPMKVAKAVVKYRLDEMKRRLTERAAGE